MSGALVNDTNVRLFIQEKLAEFFNKRVPGVSKANRIDSCVREGGRVKVQRIGILIRKTIARVDYSLATPWMGTL